MVDFTLTPVDINKLTKSTKTLVVRLRRQRELTCVPQTHQVNHLSHATLRVVITTCTHFAMFLSFPMAFSSATENYFSQIGSPYSLKINPLVQITQMAINLIKLFTTFSFRLLWIYFCARPKTNKMLLLMFRHLISAPWPSQFLYST